jgi:hypothetical protein
VLASICDRTFCGHTADVGVPDPGASPVAAWPIDSTSAVRQHEAERRPRPSLRPARPPRNPCGPAMGPPDGTASSGSTSPPLDTALLREFADELGYWAAIIDEADIERHGRLNAALERNCHPHRSGHLKRAASTWIRSPTAEAHALGACQ